MTLRQIDLLDPRLSVTTALALERMLDKREFYVDQCRPRDAHGAGMMIWILYQTALEIKEIESKTAYGDL